MQYSSWFETLSAAIMPIPGATQQDLKHYLSTFADPRVQYLYKYLGIADSSISPPLSSMKNERLRFV